MSLGSHARLDGGVLVPRESVLLTGATLLSPHLGSQSTSVSSCPNLGSLRTRGSRSTRRSRLVSKQTNMQIERVFSHHHLSRRLKADKECVPAGYFTTGHRMTADELKAVQGRLWEE